MLLPGLRGKIPVLEEFTINEFQLVSEPAAPLPKVCLLRLESLFYRRFNAKGEAWVVSRPALLKQY